MASENNIHIQHVINGGEKELTINNKTYKIYGFCDNSGAPRRAEGPLSVAPYLKKYGNP